jgi:8-oxo-dGTP pyrophosphatase MutT (NUDIX family)
MGKENEIVDLVDVSGQIMKKGIPRPEAEQHPGLYLQIVIAVIFDDAGKVLVQKRALTKRTCPGDLDHVCGAVESGETPEMATTRESLEETGLNVHDLKIVEQKLNSYGRFRYLLAGIANGEPNSYDTVEVEWVKFISPEELKAKNQSGELTFVGEFFEDMELALNARDK